MTEVPLCVPEANPAAALERVMKSSNRGLLLHHVRYGRFGRRGHTVLTWSSHVRCGRLNSAAASIEEPAAAKQKKNHNDDQESVGIHCSDLQNARIAREAAAQVYGLLKVPSIDSRRISAQRAAVAMTDIVSDKRSLATYRNAQEQTSAHNARANHLATIAYAA
jgi:hypothetical protein